MAFPLIVFIAFVAAPSIAVAAANETSCEHFPFFDDAAYAHLVEKYVVASTEYDARTDSYTATFETKTDGGVVNFLNTRIPHLSDCTRALAEYSRFQRISASIGHLTEDETTTIYYFDKDNVKPIFLQYWHGKELQFRFDGLRPCQTVNFTLSSATKQLGSLEYTVQPDHAPIAQVDAGFTWVELGFPDFAEVVQCRGDRDARSYRVTCDLGRHDVVLRENSTVRVTGMTPFRESLTCSVSFDDEVVQNVNVATVNELPPALFAALDDAVHMVGNQPDFVLNGGDESTRFSSNVEVYDVGNGNATVATVSAKVAVEEGIKGLKPATHYRACLVIQHADGGCLFPSCRPLRSCQSVYTLPSLNKAEINNNSSSSGSSNTGLTVVVSLMFVAVVALAAVLFLTNRRLDKSGAPSMANVGWNFDKM